MKKHPTMTRDHEADMKALADAFVDGLTLTYSKKTKCDTWGCDPEYVLGYADMSLEEQVLYVIGYEVVETCEHCGHSPERNKIDDQAREYARALWQDLGSWIGDAWRKTEKCDKCGCVPNDDDRCACCSECDKYECNCNEKTCAGCGEYVSLCTCEDEEVCPDCDEVSCVCCSECGCYECECDDEEEEEDDE